MFNGVGLQLVATCGAHGSTNVIRLCRQHEVLTGSYGKTRQVKELFHKEKTMTKIEHAGAAY